MVSLGTDSQSQLENYESYRFVPNSLVNFYPKQVQKLLARKHKLNSQQQTSACLTANLKLNKAKNGARVAKKMRNLVVCQANFMQVLLHKIERRSKPIRKQESLVSANLKRKRINLDQENFDIISVLKQAVAAQEKGKPESPLAQTDRSEQAAPRDRKHPMKQPAPVSRAEPPVTQMPVSAFPPLNAITRPHFED